MSIPIVINPDTQPKISVTAHQSHWADILTAIFKGVNAAQPFLVSVIPAPVEFGIEIAQTIEPIISAVVGQKNGTP